MLFVKKQILIIDDEPLVRKSLSYHLKKAGFDIIEADSGASAINLVLEYDINLIICDLTLPDINGIELIKKIKNKKKQVPILVLSGCADDEIIDNVIRSGASGYLEKPFLKKNLLSCVEKILTSEEQKPSCC